MTNLLWIEILATYMSLSRTGMGQVRCGTPPSANCSCDSNVTVIGNQTSTFYRLNGSRVTLVPDRPIPAIQTSGLLLVWQSRPGSLGSVTTIEAGADPQLMVDSETLTINPMDERVNDTQFRFVLISSGFVVLYRSEWAAARLGTKPSIVRYNKPQRSLNVILGCPLEFRVNVTSGVPDPTNDGLKTDADEDVQYQLLADGWFRFGPVKESDEGTYLLTVSNCLGNDSLMFILNVLTENASSDTTGYNITVRRGGSVNFSVSASGIPQPNVTWIRMFKSAVPCLEMEQPAPSHTVAVGQHTCQGTLSLVNNSYRSEVQLLDVQGNMSGTYQSIIDNGHGDAQKVVFRLLVIDVPAAPIINVNGSSNDSVMLFISEPCYTGGLPIRYYYITYRNGENIVVRVNASDKTVELFIGDLMSRSPYTISVRAVNDIGGGPASVRSITTHGVPGAIVFDTSRLFAIQHYAECDYVTFETPAPVEGGSPVLNYQVIYTPYGGFPLTKTVAGLFVYIYGLKESHLYSIQLRARNVYGYGPLSSAFIIATPKCPSSASQPAWIGIVIAIAVIEFIVIVIIVVVYVLRTKKKGKPSDRREMNEQSGVDVSVVFESVVDAGLQFGESLTASPLYESQTTMQTKESYGVTADKSIGDRPK